MHITKVFIDGFGIYHHFSLDLQPGLTVIVGQNEAGKTTLLNFLRAMLWGFSRGKGRYQPLQGGKLGGQLFLAEEDGQEYILSRKGKGRGTPVLRYLDGSSAQGELDQVFGGITETMYNTVFALGLGELEQLKLLEDTSVANHIYGVGLTAIPLPQIEQRLEQAGKELFNPSGRSQGGAIRATLQQLDQIETEIVQSKQELEQYNQVRASLEEKQAAQEQVKGELSRASQGRQWLEALEQAWPTWQELAMVRGQLGQLEQITSFPAQGVWRLDTLQERKDDLERQYRQTIEEIRDLQEQRDGLVIDQKILNFGAEIIQAQEGLGLYRQKLETKEGLKSQRKRLEVQWDEQAVKLGEKWPPHRVNVFPVTLTLRGKVDDFRDELASKQRRLDQAQLAWGQVQINLHHAQEEVTLAHEAWDNCPTVDPIELENQEGLLNQARDVLNRWNDVRLEMAFFQKQKTGTAKSGQLGKALLTLAGLGSTLGLWWLGQVGVAVMVVLFAVVLWWALWARERSLGTGDPLEERARQAQQLEQKLTTLAQNLALSLPLTLEKVNQLSQELQKRWHTVWERERLEKNLQEKDSALRRRKAEVQGAGAVLSETKDSLDLFQDSWSKWVTDVGLEPGLSPEQTLVLLTEVKQGRELLQQVSYLEQELEQLNRWLEDYRKRVNGMLAELGYPQVEDVALGVLTLVQVWETARENQRKDRELGERLLEKKTSAQRLHENVGSVEREITQLLHQGGASDQEQFRARAKVSDDLQSLSGKRQQLLITLQTLLAVEQEQLPKVEAELANFTPVTLAVARERAQAQEGELEHCYEKLQQELGALTQRLESMESAEDYSRLLQKRSMLVNQIQNQAEEWAVVQVTKSLLTQARAKYERERQPAVLKHSSKYFSIMTGGRYRTVWAPLGEKKVQVTRFDGCELIPQQLSRGAVEQLYLAMRLGLVEEFRNRATPLPLILDDLLVNFDPQRLRGVWQVLGEVATGQQVLFFTCHPHVVEAARETVSGLQVIELGAVADG